jgi:acetyl-CoA carboxylase biotin carboxyl carrier protein
MDLSEIRQILEMMREHELAEFELAREGMTLRLRKQAAPQQWPGQYSPGQYSPGQYSPGPYSPGPYAPSALPPVPPGMHAPPAAVAPAAAPVAPEAPPVLTAANDDVDLAIVKSPIVGTFYRANEPGAKPLADTGQTVKKGQALCIIEAMKLMNEITADCDGEVVKVYVENGHAVQYGERLFAIRPLG